MRSLLRALIVYGKIKTTKTKAKFIQGQADKLVTLAKKGTVAARRKVLGFLGNDRKTTDYLFQKLLPVFKNRQSGYTRLTLLPRRRGDNAEMVRLEWVDKIVEEVKKQKPKTKKSKKVESKPVKSKKTKKDSKK